MSAVVKSVSYKAVERVVTDVTNIWVIKKKA